MELKNARYDYLENGLPALRLTIDGVEVVIDAQQKPYLLEHGIVSVPLPQEHLGLLPPVDVPGDRKQGVAGFRMECCATKDKTVLRLTKALIQAVENDSFKPGPVSLD